MRLICSSVSLPVATSKTAFLSLLAFGFSPYLLIKFDSSLRKFGFKIASFRSPFCKFTALKFDSLCKFTSVKSDFEPPPESKFNG